MERIILCDTKQAKWPYHFVITGIDIFSYEELCFYIEQNLPLFYPDFLDEPLLLWIETEIGMEGLANKLRSMKQSGISTRKQIMAILEAGKFYTDIEIQDIMHRLDHLALKSIGYQKKAYADVLAAHGKFLMAGSIYDWILELEDTKREQELICDVYHNRGVCYAKNMEFEKAETCFLEAYSNYKNEESCFLYFLMLYRTKDDLVIRNEIARLNLAVDFYTEFMDRMEQEAEGIYEISDYKALKRANYNLEKGNVPEFDRRIRSLLEKWKREYRRSMD